LPWRNIQLEFDLPQQSTQHNIQLKQPDERFGMNPNTGLEILVLDDVLMNLELISETLTPLGFNLHMARDISGAEALLMRQRFDLYLLDIQLPDGNGDALLAKLRKAGDQTPAIAVTGELDRERKQLLSATGFNEVFAKPYSLNALANAVQRLLGVRKSGDNSDSFANASYLHTTRNPAFDQFFDLTQALSTTGGDEPLAVHLRALFRKDLQVRIDEIRRAFSQKNELRFAEERHKLAGAAGFVGATEMSQLLNALKAQPDEVNLEALESLCQRMLET
jgi:CheY-like chemotaxis protein/HPt (histidine-containing phosphotransfer) domain-containing protein